MKELTGLPEAIREAIECIITSNTVYRTPLLDELEGFALMVETALAAPQAKQRTPLSDDAIRSLVLSINGRPPTSLKIARVVEAHHGIGGAK